MEICIGSEIRVRNASKAMQTWCSENLVLPNPEYITRTQRGMWTGNTPQFLWLYRVEGDELVLPVGCGKEIRSIRLPNSAAGNRLKPFPIFIAI